VYTGILVHPLKGKVNDYDSDESSAKAMPNAKIKPKDWSDGIGAGVGKLLQTNGKRKGLVCKT